MTIPKYVVEILERAKYSFDKYDKNNIPGYTIKIEKRTEYSHIHTLMDDAFRLIKWANLKYQKLSKDDTLIAFVVDCPSETHYRKQYATITIFDPIMKYIEKYISK